MPNARLDDVELVEQETSECFDLSSDDAVYLRARPERLRVTPRFAGGGYTVHMGPYVGVLRLPSGRILRVKPKVGVRNVFYMLSRVWQTPFADDLASYERFEDILEILAEYFCDLAEDLLSRGLYRTYADTEDNLGVVRGRIAFTEDLRRNAVERQRCYCRFSEFTWDIPENRVVRQVAHELVGWGFRPELTGRLSLLDGQLGELSLSHYPGIVTDSFLYHRLNEHYRRPHLLCRLFLDAAGVCDIAGLIAFGTFLVNMNTLFESFVRVMIAGMVRRPFSIDAGHSTLRFDSANSISVYPDITARCRGQIVAVADCKYQVARLADAAAHHLYQVLSYCTVSGTERAVLVYPRHVAGIDDEISVVRSAVHVHRITVDLGAAPASLQAQFLHIASTLCGEEVVLAA